MLKPEILAEIAEKINNSIPKELSFIKDNSVAIIKEILQDTFSRMDLVTRDEFDVQTKLLHNTKQKLRELEMRLDALNNK